MRAAPGLLALLVGAGLIAGPWWSSTLPISDYPMMIVLGIVFAAIGIFAAIPDSWPRLPTLSFSLFMGTFGLVCASLALAPLHPAADGTMTIGGVPGFIRAPIPWWARLIAGLFAMVCVGTAALGVWGLVRELLGGRRPE
jgi:hypothetical protein